MAMRRGIEEVNMEIGPRSVNRIRANEEANQASGYRAELASLCGWGHCPPSKGGGGDHKSKGPSPSRL
ncbi:hypothetical protein O181_132063 [Austropuccinia psidii MF-1]|uniref:Uncharacterized protein n=1 Tax=Austropuccinia psidii MF-1 TaxID=1389203 RepID=A0A9Q3L1N5_9BASI|nr:hypothetical protein [Austropuccinia psidii MF-1]